MTQAIAAIVIYAGLAGAAGVALAAMGAHGEGYAALTPPAYFLLMHAVAAVAIAALATRAGHPGALVLAALILLLGVSLFSGDIAVRTLLGHRLFPMAAPLGGSTMIVGWLVLAAAALWELLANRG